MKSNMKTVSNKPLKIYLMFTLGLSILCYILILPQRNYNYVLLLMYCPGIAAVVTVLFHQYSFKELGFGLKKPRYLVLTFSLTIVAVLVYYIFVWIIFPDTLDRKKLEEYATNWLPTLMKFAPIWIFSLISAFGEELGWRGFLVPQLNKSLSFWKVVLVSGIIWSVWHWPLIIWGGYNNSEIPIWTSLLFFTLSIIVGCTFYTYLRLKSESVWPTVILHGTYNTIVQDFLAPLIKNNHITNWIFGEFGFGEIILSCLMLIVFWKDISQFIKEENQARGNLPPLL
jgi:uncharacterized protein